MSEKRTFLLLTPKLHHTTGHFVSTTPRGAALKAASQGIKNIILREPYKCSMRFYKGSVKKLRKPVVVTRSNGTKVKYSKIPKVRYVKKVRACFNIQ